MAMTSAKDFPGAPGSEYDWDGPDPKQQAESRRLKAAYAKQFDAVTDARTAAGKLIAAASEFSDSLGYVQAFGMTDRENLYPFPGPGALADVELLELRAALVAAQATLVFLNTPIDVPDVGQVTPLTALRRIA